MRILKSAAAAALALMLSSCLTSEGLLFTAKNARAKPFAPGAWTSCQHEEDAAEPECKTMQIARDASGVYTFSMEGESETTKALFKRLQKGAYATQLWGEGDDDPFYFLTTENGAERVMSMIVCEDLPATFRDAEVAKGRLEVEDGATTCVAKTAAAVSAAARAWLKTGNHATGARIVYTPQ